MTTFPLTHAAVMPRKQTAHPVVRPLDVMVITLGLFIASCGYLAGDVSKLLTGWS